MGSCIKWKWYLEMDYHKSVLLQEVLDYLRIEKDRWYLDATLGDGGHSLEILKRGAKVLGLDVDPHGLDRARIRFQEALINQDKYCLIRGNFRDIDQEVGDKNFWGVIFDLGVSSSQIDTPQRGFSFQNLGPLDMRMDPNLAVCAQDLINALNYGELTKLFKTYGEERRAKEIARSVLGARPVNNTKQLADVIGHIAYGKDRITTLARVFQSLRIAVNDELNALREALPKALSATKSKGKILVISFHSLEDRIVKDAFKEWERQNLGMIITKKPIMAQDLEVGQNTRARSAKLRVFETR